MPTATILVDGKKQCTTCLELKPLDEFVSAINTTTRKAASCKLCVNTKKLSLWHTDLIFREKFKKQRKKSQLKLKYGLTIQEYENLLVVQNNKCKICSFEFNEEDSRTIPRVDHCHKTGKIRGLLCNNCNLGIGNFMDNPDHLIKASHYLIQSRK